MATAAKLTPDEFAAMGDAAKGYDLVNGALVEIPMSKLSSAVAGELFGLLWAHTKATQSGRVFLEGMAYRCFPDDPARIRKADVSYFGAGRILPAEINSDFAFDIAPDFVCEVVSPTDTFQSIRLKRAEWLEAGVRLYWQIEPEERNVRVYTKDVEYIDFRVGDTLSADPVIPGFSLPVAALFDMT